MARPALEEWLRERIRQRGRITFAEFQEACLYSPLGGFYATRDGAITSHFHTSPTSHSSFGVLIARQLDEMWRVLGEPPRFHAMEVGSGDGALARSTVTAIYENHPRFGEALVYVASDYAPVWPADDVPPGGDAHGANAPVIRRVKAAGLAPFRGVTGCILTNELLDNFPVHRFVIEGGEVRELFVTLDGDRFAGVIGEPSTPALANRLGTLGTGLPDGSQGEVSLAMEDWVRDVARTLDRGFVLTIDYGGLAADLYSPGNPNGTLTCFREHGVTHDPYEHIGEQDITTHVDFSSLQALGEEHGLSPIGYARQSEFLENLGFPALMAGIAGQGLSDAFAEFHRIAMMALVDPEQMGDFKVLVQAKGVEPDVRLMGFTAS